MKNKANIYNEEYLNKIFKNYYLEDLISIVKHYYDESHRFYHNWNHIKNGFFEFNLFFKERIPLHIVIAWLFHDIVYQPSNKNNEIDSVYLMNYILKKYCLTFYKDNYKEIEKAEKYIKATINHTIDNDSDCLLPVFLDVDMAYLGMNYNDFLTNRDYIRREYKEFNEEVFNKGSIYFCESLLRRQRIFQSEYFFNKLEKKCRSNLKIYIKKLQEVKN